jgi:hypothetical protein
MYVRLLYILSGVDIFIIYGWAHVIYRGRLIPVSTTIILYNIYRTLVLVAGLLPRRHGYDALSSMDWRWDGPAASEKACALWAQNTGAAYVLGWIPRCIPAGKR